MILNDIVPKVWWWYYLIIKIFLIIMNNMSTKVDADHSQLQNCFWNHPK